LAAAYSLSESITCEVVNRADTAPEMIPHWFFSQLGMPVGQATV